MFHVNTKTGEVGKCEAGKGKCPFGDSKQHFTSAEAARASFEANQVGSFNDEALKLILPLRPVKPLAEVRAPKNETEDRLFDYLKCQFHHLDSTRLFELVIDNKFWSMATFPQEFKKATDSIEAGMSNPLESARGHLYDAILRNGKLDKFIKSLLVKRG